MKTAVSHAVRLILCSSVAAALPAVAEEREARALTGFTGITIGGGIDMRLQQGDRFEVEVITADGKLDDIVTEVSNGTLEIRRRQPQGIFDWGKAGTVHVTLPALTSLTASGGSDVRSEGTFTSDAVEIVASGGSDLVLNVAASNLQVTVSGGSDVRLSGTARSASVQSSGGSDLNARELMVDDVEVQSSGGSDLSIAVRNKIVGNASGGSDISYTGAPTVVQVNSSGGGGVHQR